MQYTLEYRICTVACLVLLPWNKYTHARMTEVPAHTPGVSVMQSDHGAEAGGKENASQL